KLRQIADALDATSGLDARQTNLLWAYEDAILTRYPPTLAAVKAVFVKRFGGQSWPVEWSARKTICIVLELPLAEDRRRPRRRPAGASQRHAPATHRHALANSQPTKLSRVVILAAEVR